MTQKEAYEKLRRENLVLKNRIRGLESSGLEDRLAEVESARDYWKERYERCHENAKRESIRQEEMITKLQREVGRLERELSGRYREAVSKETARLVEEIASLRKELGERNDEIAKLERKLGRDHLNSSVPSTGTSFPQRRKIPNGRVATGRRPGAQDGHSGHRRRTVDDLECDTETIAVSYGNGIPEGYVPTGRKVEKRVYDIRIGVSCRKYVADEYVDTATGYLHHAPFPKGISNETTYGPGVRTLAWYLCNACNVSVAKASSLMAGLTGGRIRPSTGFISQLAHQMAAMTAEARDGICGRLGRSAVMHTDITVGNVNGHYRAINVFTDGGDVLYLVKAGKSIESIGTDTPLENFLGTLVHDHDRSYYRFGSQHQECLAHIMRYLTGAIELEPSLVWHGRMKDLLGRMMAGCDNGTATEQVKDGWRREYDTILDTADREYRENPPGCIRDGINLASRLRQYRKETLLFLDRPDVDRTNNISERLLRQFKRHQKACGCFRSDRGAEDFASGLSIIESAKLRGNDPMAKAYSVFSALFS